MILLFGTSPRCGTTSVNRAINRSTNINLLVEPFNPDCNNCIRAADNGLILEDDIGMVFNRLDTMMDEGIKHLSHQIPDQYLQKLFDITDKLILTHRKDQFEVALSIWMSSNYEDKTGYSFWNEWVDGYGNGKEKQDFPDFHTLKRDPIPEWMFNHRYDLLKEKMQLYDDIASHKKTYRLYYEDWYNDNVLDNFLELCDFLGCKLRNNYWKEILVPKGKFNIGNIKYDLIPNAYEMKNKIGDSLIW